MVKRSTCASGNGYVPSNSTGFCVAMTRNGRASSCEWTSTVTRRSCMHSSRPDCVLGEARLISSTITTLAKIGPGRNSKRSSRWLKTLVPTTSAGSRSAVHWMRANCRSMERASARARAGWGRGGGGLLAAAGESLDEAVPPGQHGDEEVLEHLAPHLGRALDV